MQNHALSETLSPLSKLGESGGESEKHMGALSASSACSARRLSLPTLSAPSSLSGYSLTRAKHENGAKRAFKDRKPFLRLKLEKSREEVSKESVDWNVESITEAKNRARKPKTSAFKRILGLGVISRFLEVEETSPPLCNLLFSS